MDASTGSVAKHAPSMSAAAGAGSSGVSTATGAAATKVAASSAVRGGSAPATTAEPAGADASGTPTLFFLDNLGRVLRASVDGKQHMPIVQNRGFGPDGVAVDVTGGHVFWTNMGLPNSDDGTVMRADLDGKNPTTVVARGTFTPKQLKYEPTLGKLFWSDREGMRVMRSNLDGSELTTLVVTGTTEKDRGDASNWCVGIAIDPVGGKLYWTQKGPDNGGQGAIKRANLELPEGQDPAHRTDIEVLFAKLPEPIDLDLDLDNRLLYWTDRGDNTVSRAPLDMPAGVDPAQREDREILVRGLGEAIGITLDLPNDRMFYTALSGTVGVSALDGSGAHDVMTGQGALTGIVLVSL
jgi:DNA-binding beta-propeller fold protein YncE